MPPASNIPSSDSVIQQIRLSLQEALGTRRYLHWFGTSTTQLEICDTTLVIQVQSPYLVNWIQRQFAKQLGELACAHLGAAATVRFEVGSEVHLTPLPETAGATNVQSSVGRKTEKPRTRRKAFRLADFVVGPCNELAMAAVLQVTEEPGSLSPLFLHGPVGNGKTHLLEALRQQLRTTQPELQVALLNAEHFANYFTQALDARTLPSFRQRFRSVEILLVDDIDFLDGKMAIQEEFLHTVKQFEEEGRQVVVTSNRHPRLLGKTSEELISRYMAGLVCRLESPNLETRLKMVRTHAARHRVEFAAAALEHVAQRFTNNVRELEGAVNLLATYGNMEQKKVTETMARQLLGRLERDSIRVIRLGDIENAICEMFGLNKDDLRSKSRKQNIVQPRMLAMYLARRLTATPYSEIGSFFGGRIHSTVMSAEKKVETLIESGDTIKLSAEKWTVRDVVDKLEERIRVG